MRRDRSIRVVVLILVVAVTIGCSATGSGNGDTTSAVIVGTGPVPKIFLSENHSSALTVWRQSGVRDRVLVTLDGHLGYDWLPDRTVARIAAARPEELSDLEIHPYALETAQGSGFSNSDFVYAAARLGVVRRVIWVVPDATFDDVTSLERLARAAIFDRIRMLPLTEGLGLRREGRTIAGRLLGLPVTICRLADLPEIREPVLLDIDLDYFTTRSAADGWITERPWTTPRAVLGELERRGLQTDLVTISLSTIGGYFPPANRWMGDALRERLGGTGADDNRNDEIQAELETEEPSGEAKRVAPSFGRGDELVPHDAAGWLLMARAMRAAKRGGEAEDAWAQAIELDPLLEHEQLFEADRLFQNRLHHQAGALYRQYLRAVPRSRFRMYALRQNALCLLRSGRIDDARSGFRHILRLVPDHADSHMDLALALQASGRTEDAVVELRTARRLVPENAAYAMTLGTLYAQMGWFNEAADELGASVQLRPCWSLARGQLAHVLHELGRSDDAARHLQAGLALQPDKAVLEQLATELMRSGAPITTVKAVPGD